LTLTNAKGKVLLVHVFQTDFSASYEQDERVMSRTAARRPSWLVTALCLLLFVLIGCSPENYPQTTLLPRGDFARIADDLLDTTVKWALLVFVLVEGVLIYAIFRFRGKPGDPEPHQIHGNTTVEIIWTVIPALILAAIAVPTVRAIFQTNATPAKDALTIEVVGHQWWWEFRYPDLDVGTANEVYVPVGSQVAIELESTDVIHSFYVPRFGWMRDAVPGQVNRMYATVTREGVFEGACTQFCGMQHAWMRSRVTAVPREQFDTWIQQQRQPAASGTSRGQQVFLEKTCVSCHAIRGMPAPAQVGPDLTHLASRSTLGAGVIPNTPENLRLWIRDAPTVKPGVLMPPFRGMTEEDVRALADFLTTLQ
jgi:cytochrome c oxidase subunit 2